MGERAAAVELHPAQVIVELRFTPEQVDGAIDAGIARRAAGADRPTFSAALREVLAGADGDGHRLDRAAAAREELHDLLGDRAAAATGPRVRWRSHAPFAFHVGEADVAGEADLRRVAWEVHRAFEQPLVAALPAVRPAIGAAVRCAGEAEMRRRALVALEQSRLLGEPFVVGREQELDLTCDLRCRRSTLLSEVALHLAAGRTAVLACAVDGVPQDAEPREDEAVARGVARVLEQRAGATLFTTAPRTFHAVVPWSAEHAVRAAEEVRAAAATYRGYFFNMDDIFWEYPELGATVRVSLGVASGTTGDPPEALLAAADEALLEAAATGDRVVATRV
jgi:hypothetical protein